MAFTNKGDLEVSRNLSVDGVTRLGPYTTAERDALSTLVSGVGYLVYNTDDDSFQQTIDGGTTWTNLGADLPTQFLDRFHKQLLSDTGVPANSFGVVDAIIDFLDDVLVPSVTGDITDNGDGTYTLAAGRNYKLTGDIRIYYNSTAAMTPDWRWHDGSGYVGSYGGVNAHTSQSRGANGPAIYVTGVLTAPITVSLRVARVDSQVTGILRGSYVLIEQLANNTAVIDTTEQVPVTDEAEVASRQGYLDVGEVRIQWLTGTASQNAADIFFPQPFKAGTTPHVTGSATSAVGAGYFVGTSISSATAHLQFRARGWRGDGSYSALNVSAQFIAIGAKP